jgi:NADH dehydrogenase/NADH:ubiquinone oxidoreductase subunit G
MGDFEEIPKNKVSALANMLAKETALEEPLVPYYDIPMASRLPIAEKVYKILGRDDNFWCEFRRIEGYHLEAAGRADEARKARLEALEIAEKLLRKGATTRKETLVIAAAMRKITGDAAGAAKDLEEARTLTFESKDLGAESSEGLNGYLDTLIEELLKR